MSVEKEWWQEHGYAAATKLTEGSDLWLCVRTMVTTYRISLCDPGEVYQFWCYPQDEFDLREVIDWMMDFAIAGAKGDPHEGWVKHYPSDRRPRDDIRYLYENHGHDVTDVECIKCWQRIAHESQLSAALVVEGLQENLQVQSERLLNILGRASNVVEISWSVPKQEPGSLIDTLLASIVALGEAIAPPKEHACTPPELEEPHGELWRCQCGQLWQNSPSQGTWITVSRNSEAVFTRIGIELP